MSSEPMRPVFMVKRLPHALDLPLPSYATIGAAGIDLCAALAGNEVEFSGFFRVPTGFEVAVPDGHVGLVLGRSGLAFKQSVYCAHVGTIDSDYRGEIKVLLYASQLTTFRHGDRIAQLVILPAPRCEIWETSEEMPSTVRGSNGFGSTGR